MPSVHAATLRLIADSFTLGFLNSGGFFGHADRFTTASDSVNHLEFAGNLRFLGIWTGTQWRTNTAFTFTGLTATTARLVWTFGSDSVTAVATVAEEWIEFEITAVTYGVQTGFEDLVIGLQTENYVQGPGFPNVFSLYVRTEDETQAWGFVNGSEHWQHAQSGDVQIRLKGSVTDGPDGWVGKKFGLYIATAARGQELIPLLADSLGLPLTGRVDDSRNCVLFTDVHETNGGAVNAGNAAAYATRMADFCDLVGAEEALLFYRLWKNYNDQDASLPGISTLVAGLQSRGLRVGLHNTLSQIDPAFTGPNSYITLYPGESVASDFGTWRVLHFYDGITELSDLANQLPLDFAAVYTLLGCDGGVYLDGHNYDSTNNSFNTTSYLWYFAQWELIQVTTLLPDAPVYGNATWNGLTIALSSRFATIDMIPPNVFGDTLTEIIDANCQYWDDIGDVIGVPNMDAGWLQPKADGVNFITQAELDHFFAGMTARDGKFTLLGAIQEFEDSITAGVNWSILVGGEGVSIYERIERQVLADVMTIPGVLGGIRWDGRGAVQAGNLYALVRLVDESTEQADCGSERQRFTARLMVGILLHQPESDTEASAILINRWKGKLAAKLRSNRLIFEDDTNVRLAVDSDVVETEAPELENGGMCAAVGLEVEYVTTGTSQTTGPGITELQEA